MDGDARSPTGHSWNRERCRHLPAEQLCALVTIHPSSHTHLLTVLRSHLIIWLGRAPITSSLGRTQSWLPITRGTRLTRTTRSLAFSASVSKASSPPMQNHRSLTGSDFKGHEYVNDDSVVLWFNGIAYSHLTATMLPSGRLHVHAVKRAQNILTKVWSASVESFDS